MKPIFWHIVLLAFVPRAGAVPNSFITSLPVAQDQVLTRFQTHDYSAATPGASLFRLDEPSSLAYGATGTTALFAQFSPVMDSYKAGSVSTQMNGFDDTQLFARYTLYSNDGPGYTGRLTPLAGLYAPNGAYNIKNQTGGAVPALDVNSGSVAPYFGTAATYSNLRWEADWDATYRYNPPAAGGFTLGNTFHTDASLQVRLIPNSLPKAGVPSFFLGVLDVNFVVQNKSRIGGFVDPNTGGLTLNIDYGIQYSSIRSGWGASFQSPAVQNLNGTDRLREDWQVLAFYSYYLSMPSWGS